MSNETNAKNQPAVNESEKPDTAELSELEAEDVAGGSVNAGCANAYKCC